jgi:hypothetical protein
VGTRAGRIARVACVCSLAMANVAVLYAFNTGTLSSLPQLAFSTCAASTNSMIAEAAQYCLNPVITVVIPIETLLTPPVTLIYSGVFGGFYDHFPRKSPSARGMTVGIVGGSSLLVLRPRSPTSASQIAHRNDLLYRLDLCLRPADRRALQAFHQGGSVRKP